MGTKLREVDDYLMKDTQIKTITGNQMTHDEFAEKFCQQYNCVVLSRTETFTELHPGKMITITTKLFKL